VEKDDFKIIHKSDDISNVLNSLHKQIPYSIVIIDENNCDRLERVLEWFSTKSQNIPIFVLLNNDKTDSIPSLVKSYSSINFILSTKNLSKGSKINGLSSFCFSKFFLLLSTDTNLINFEGELLSTFLKDQKRVAFICPHLINKVDEIMPTIRKPRLSRKQFDLDYDINQDFTQITLYPVYGYAFYNLEIFNNLHGFDENIQSFHWQTLDFGLRSWLFGYTGYSSPLISYKMPYFLELIESRDKDSDYKRCLSRVLGIKQQRGRNIMHWSLGLIKLQKKLVKPFLSDYQLDYPALIKIFEGDEKF